MLEMTVKMNVIPATSCKLVDRQARNPSPHATAERGFWSDDDLEKTIEATRTDMESEQLDRSDSQRLSAQFPPAEAVISTEMRLTTRELHPERTAGPYSPDSHCQTGLLEGRTAIASSRMHRYAKGKLFSTLITSIKTAVLTTLFHS